MRVLLILSGITPVSALFLSGVILSAEYTRLYGIYHNVLNARITLQNQLLQLSSFILNNDRLYILTSVFSGRQQYHWADTDLINVFRLLLLHHTYFQHFLSQPGVTVQKSPGYLRRSQHNKYT